MTNNFICRRQAIKRGAMELLAITSMPIFFLPRTAHAGTGAKKDFHYQEHPKAGNSCSNCSAFYPPSTQNSVTEGTCKIIAGPINPDGWCMAFSKKE